MKKGVLALLAAFALVLGVAICCIGCSQFFTAPPSVRRAPDLFWNMWVEAEKEERFKPVPHLQPGGSYRLCLDLAALKYLVAGVQTSSTSDTTKGEVEEWLKKATKPPTLKVLLLADPEKFDFDTKEIVQPMEIDLKALRIVTKIGQPEIPDPFAVLRKAFSNGTKPDFEIGNVVTFEVKTREREGPAWVAFSIWCNGRPIDEVSRQLCIIKTPVVMKEKCQISGGAANARGLPLVGVGTEKGEPPAAALHFVSLGQEGAAGIFRANSWATDQFLMWGGGPLDDFRKRISTGLNALSPESLSDGDLLNLGESLFKILFPQEAKSYDDKNVREEVLRYFRDQLNRLEKNKDASDCAPPTLFARMIPTGSSPCEPVPLGLMAVKLDDRQDMTRENGKFLGEYFLIEAPLHVQNYQPYTGHLSRWVMVLPPPEGVQDQDIKNALEELSPAREKWSTTEKFDRMRVFGQWLQRTSGGKEEKDPPTILVTLSHHKDNSLQFLPPPADIPLLEPMIEREFAQPSVAIVAGCGTAGPTAVNLIKALNEHGFTTIIATSTVISGSLAGAFLKVFSEQISTPQPVGLAYWKAIKELRKKGPLSKPGLPFGAQALKFTLLGNGKVQLWLPQK